jgi:uncharacterized protein YxjI
MCTSKITSITSVLTFACCLCYGQNSSVSNEEKVHKILKERQKIVSVINFSDTYRIQIFTGTSEELKKKMTEFKRQFPELDAVVSFSAPLYKLWVGNFRTRIEAERQLQIIRKSYKQALVIKPKK